MSATIDVKFEPDGRSVKIEAGSTVLSAARQLGLFLNSPCGGHGVCGNCRVEIVTGAPEPTEADRRHFRPAELKAGWRLACQAKLVRRAVIAVPEATGARDQKILTAGVAHAVTLRPNVRKVRVQVPQPSLADPRADADRLLDACQQALGGAGKEVRLDSALMATLPRRLRSASFDVTAVLAGQEITWVEADRRPGGPAARAVPTCGVAVDLGTTTVVGTLFDLTTGRQLAVASDTNPQIALGDDVVSRIHYASAGPRQLADLQRRAVGCINEIVAEVCRRAQVRRRDIYELTLVGNTTMNHLLLGIDPSAVAQAPYVAVLRSGLTVRAGDVGLRLSPGARLYTMPNIAGFVGGDTVGVILATDLMNGDGVRLAVDIGTNGEMVLATKGGLRPARQRPGRSEQPRSGERAGLSDARGGTLRPEGLVACSTAAGPAFEGARITHGMRASGGAIEGVAFDGEDLVLTTIDNEAARGLCGTGLIEAVATLLSLGVIDRTGRLRTPEDCGGLPRKVARRVVRADGGCRVVLAHAEVAGVPYDVCLTQRDVREVQLAKAAIAAGIRTLLDEYGLQPADIDEVLLAGAFGNRIRVECAVGIGLLPDIPVERVKFVGNAAAEGARMVLLDRTLRDEAERVSLATRYLELAGRPDFQTAFADAMFFPG